MKRRIRFPVFVVAAVLAASCGGGGAVPSAEGVLPEAPPVPPPLRAPAPPPPTTGASVETNVSVEATVTSGTVAITTTSTTTTTTSPSTTTSVVVAITSTTAATTTTTAAPPVTTTTSVPEIWEYYKLEDGTIVSVDGTTVSDEEYRTIASSKEYVPVRILPVPVLPDSASELRGRDLSAGFNYSCGLRSPDNSVECWYWGEPYRYREYHDLEGDFYDGWGEPSVETPEGAFAVVDAGREAACGVRPTGEVECWGANPLADVPPPEGEFVSVSVGLEHACAIRPSGEVECWGTSPARSGPVYPLEGEFTSIAAAYNFMCGLRPGGEVECWGVGYTSFADEKFAPPTGVFKAISAGGGDVCGLRPEGSVECWGNYDPTNEVGKSGNWAITYLQPPEGEFASVVVGKWGGGYACGLRPDQTAECWSKEWKRGSVDVDGPPEGEKFIRLGVGRETACGVRVDNTLLCWHSQSENNDRLLPLEEFNLSGEVLSYEFGNMGAQCLLFLDETVHCFGDLGEAIPPGVFISVSVGASSVGFDAHACGLRPSGEVECWGSNDFGEATPPEGVFTQVVASVDFSCGLRPTGGVECWGGGSAGRHSKVVPPRERLVFVDAGWGGNDGPWPFADREPGLSGNHYPYFSDQPDRYDFGYSCGLREDGSLLCWGNGSLFGADDLYYGEGPILSPPEGVFVDVGVGKHQACALRKNHRAECWGLYGDYVYGEGEAGSYFVSLEVGGWHACGLRSGGQIRCWDLRNQEPVLPTWVDSFNKGTRKYSLISAGYFHVCGYRIGGSFNRGGVDCWGPPITRDMRSP